jgi:hypothetical protein
MSITIQVDDTDVETKRGFHVDGVNPPLFKAFVDLNDVDQLGDGPYTVVPSSHRHVIRKWLNCAYARVRGYHERDMRLFYRDGQSRQFFGSKGTCVLSTQTLAHKGWHHQDVSRRFILICYLTIASNEAPFTLGRAALTRSSPA